jgi:VanZ family protein
MDAAATLSISEDGRRAGAWFWPLALAATIFFCSAHGQVAAPSIENFDKLAHFLIYGLLATLLARCPGLPGGKALGVTSAVVIASFYGFTDEYHQSFTPGRSVSAADWLADTAGAALAVLLYARWRTYRTWLEWPGKIAEVEIPPASGSLSQR